MDKKLTVTERNLEEKITCTYEIILQTIIHHLGISFPLLQIFKEIKETRGEQEFTTIWIPAFNRFKIKLEDDFVELGKISDPEVLKLTISELADRIFTETDCLKDLIEKRKLEKEKQSEIRKLKNEKEKIEREMSLWHYNLNEGTQHYYLYEGPYKNLTSLIKDLNEAIRIQSWSLIKSISKSLSQYLL